MGRFELAATLDLGAAALVMRGCNLSQVARVKVLKAGSIRSRYLIRSGMRPVGGAGG